MRPQSFTEVPRLVLNSTPQRVGTGAGGFFTFAPGERVQITVLLTGTAATQTLSPFLKVGLNNTSADTDMLPLGALGAGTNAVGGLMGVFTVFVVTPVLLASAAQFFNNGVTGITNAIVQSRLSTVLTTIPDPTVNRLFLAPYFSSTGTNVTAQLVSYESSTG